VSIESGTGQIGKCTFYISDSVIVSTIGSKTKSVSGIFIIVMRYLSSNNDKKNEKIRILKSSTKSEYKLGFNTIHESL